MVTDEQGAAATPEDVPPAAAAAAAEPEEAPLWRSPENAQAAAGAGMLWVHTLPEPGARKRKAPSAAPGAPAAPGAAPQYVKLRRNEWAPGLKAPRLLPLDESYVCQCTPLPAAPLPASAPRLACGAGCLNRSMNTFCDPRTCPSRDACSNRPFHLLPSPRTRPFLTTNGRGWGLAAAERLRAGAFVVEYMGEVLNDVMCEQRLWADKERGETNFYMMEVNRNQVIDARYKGNVARLLNSACKPNCETQRWVDGATGETRVGIFTLREVEAGEELTYDYCFTHFGEDSATSFLCVCGSPDCRGTLDANPQRGLNRGRRIEVLWDDGVFYAATVASFTATTSKFRLVYDDGDAETVRLEADPSKRREDDVVWRWLEDEPATGVPLAGEGEAPAAEAQQPAAGEEAEPAVGAATEAPAEPDAAQAYLTRVK